MSSGRSLALPGSELTFEKYSLESASCSQPWPPSTSHAILSQLRGKIHEDRTCGRQICISCQIRAQQLRYISSLRGQTRESQQNLPVPKVQTKLIDCPGKSVGQDLRYLMPLQKSTRFQSGTKHTSRFREHSGSSRGLDSFRSQVSFQSSAGPRANCFP